MGETEKEWELEYNKHISGEYDERYDELSKKIEPTIKRRKDYTRPDEGKNVRVAKVAERHMKKEEYSEYRKLKAIKDNLYKVKNILKAREKIQANLEEVKVEVQRRTRVKELEKERQELEEEIRTLEERREEISRAKKNPSFKDHDKAEEELKTIRDEIKKNNNRYFENQQEFKMAIPEKITEIMKKSDEELEGDKIELSEQISKCNLVGECLMQGKSWTEIKVRLDNWEKYTGKKEDIDKIRGAKDRTKNQDSLGIKPKPRGDKTEDKDDLAEKRGKEKKEDKKETGMIKYEEKPKWWQFIKRFKKWRENRNRKEEQEEELSKNLKRTEFNEWLREVAEKGIDEVEKEQKEAAISRAKEKLQKNRQEAADRLASKYGGKYESQDGATLKKDNGREPGE